MNRYVRPKWISWRQSWKSDSEVVDQNTWGGTRDCFFESREDSGKSDVIVVDVHTDSPSSVDTDSGGVLHLGLGNPLMAFFVVDKTIVCRSSIQFLTPSDQRLTDDCGISIGGSLCSNSSVFHRIDRNSLSRDTQFSNPGRTTKFVPVDWLPKHNGRNKMTLDQSKSAFSLQISTYPAVCSLASIREHFRARKERKRLMREGGADNSRGGIPPGQQGNPGDEEEKHSATDIVTLETMINQLQARVLVLEQNPTRYLDMLVHTARNAVTPCLLRITFRIKDVVATGFLITPDGFVLTAYHVRATGEDCMATLQGGAQVPCTPVEDYAEIDLSLMKIPGNNYSFVSVAETLREDQSVGIIGFCLEHAATMNIPNLTVGRISTQVISTVMLPVGVRPGGRHPHQLCTANVNKGDSGAPVFDLYSRELVGVFRTLYTRTSDDQGQAAFVAVTGDSILWNSILRAITRHRDTL